MERIGLRPVLVAGLLGAVSICVVAMALYGVRSPVVTTLAMVTAVPALALALFEVRTQAPAVARTAETNLVDVLTRELDRSRRHEHPLAVVRLPLADGNPLGVGGQYLASVIAATLRTIDYVVPDGDSLYLVLSETSASEARACLRRLTAAHPQVFGEARARVAAFPDDGVTIAALLAVLGGEERIVDRGDLPTLARRRRITVDLTTVDVAAADAAPANVTAASDPDDTVVRSDVEA